MSLTAPLKDNDDDAFYADDYFMMTIFMLRTTLMMMMIVPLLSDINTSTVVKGKMTIMMTTMRMMTL